VFSTSSSILYLAIVPCSGLVFESAASDHGGVDLDGTDSQQKGV